jgi:hypothetical protein
MRDKLSIEIRIMSRKICKPFFTFLFQITELYLIIILSLRMLKKVLKIYKRIEFILSSIFCRKIEKLISL